MHPLSLILSGSLYSSYQMAIHITILISMNAIVFFFLNVSTHRMINKSVHKLTVIRESTGIVKTGTSNMNQAAIHSVPFESCMASSVGTES